jgi:Ca-activated chloride channel family protein
MNQVGAAREQLQARIQQMTEATGGQAFFPSSADQLDAAYDRLLAELKAQYLLGYAPSNGARDGTWRRLEVRVTPELKVRARPGYLAKGRMR